MKKFLVVILATLLVAGCASRLDQMKEAGVKPLTAAEIEALVQGNTFHLRGGQGWQWAGHFRSDGTKVAKEWWNGGEKRGSGTWEVTEDGKLCGQWTELYWEGGRHGCTMVYHDGDEIVAEPVSGGDNRSRVVKLVPGNPFEL